MAKGGPASVVHDGGGGGCASAAAKPQVFMAGRKKRKKLVGFPTWPPSCGVAGDGVEWKEAEEEDETEEEDGTGAGVHGHGPSPGELGEIGPQDRFGRPSMGEGARRTKKRKTMKDVREDGNVAETSGDAADAPASERESMEWPRRRRWRRRPVSGHAAQHFANGVRRWAEKDEARGRGCGESTWRHSLEPVEKKRKRRDDDEPDVGGFCKYRRGNEQDMDGPAAAESGSLGDAAAAFVDSGTNYPVDGLKVRSCKRRWSGSDVVEGGVKRRQVGGEGARVEERAIDGEETDREDGEEEEEEEEEEEGVAGDDCDERKRMLRRRRRTSDGAEEETCVLGRRKAKRACIRQEVEEMHDGATAVPMESEASGWNSYGGRMGEKTGKRCRRGGSEEDDKPSIVRRRVATQAEEGWGDRRPGSAFARLAKRLREMQVWGLERDNDGEIALPAAKESSAMEQEYDQRRKRLKRGEGWQENGREETYAPVSEPTEGHVCGGMAGNACAMTGNAGVMAANAAKTRGGAGEKQKDKDGGKKDGGHVVCGWGMTMTRCERMADGSRGQVLAGKETGGDWGQVLAGKETGGDWGHVLARKEKRGDWPARKRRRGRGGGENTSNVSAESDDEER
ncbi:hypothetical protein CBR_g11010 [Chara braunii]|uniref:Uncharacterized protein n=1 Tax=Chara braunii TaxID=69332 RepID=A0A388KPV2_CHABU|nr:hypothetical protein CBR_g11010 [Chara braunii]|eukprot:GBG72076.1 hypothetical protein CBR_g11010 [Chara braunii]